MTWADKYRATSFSSLIVKPEILRSVIAWVNMWKAGNPQKKVLLLHGPPGTGKTTVAYVISKEMGMKVIEMNSSEKRNSDNLMLIGKMAGLYRDLTDFQEPGSGPDKIILIDEADNIFEGRGEGSDTGGMRALGDIAQTTKNPVIVTMNDFYEFRRKEHSREITENSLEIEMLPYTRKNEKDYREFRARLKQRMHEIASTEGLVVSDEIVEGLIEKNGTDIRAAINDLESMRGSDGSFTGIRDIQESIYKVVESILFRGEMDHAIETSRDGDFTAEDLLMWMDENTGSVALSSGDRVRAYDLISICDVNIGRVRRRQHFAFKGYAEELACGTRHVMRKPNTHYVKFQFPKHIRNLSRIRIGGYSRKGLETKISRYTHMGPSRARDNMWFFVGMRKSRLDIFREISKRLMIQESELGYL